MNEKVVVITGASRGLGKILAGLCLAQGANVVVSARDGAELQSTVKEFEIRSPGKILAIPADATKEQKVANLAASAVSKFGQIDIWINNAGVWLPLAPIEQVDIKRFHDLMEVNLFGTVYGSKAALIQMKKQGFGRIVNIISSTALGGRVDLSAYTTSKFAEDGFTKCLREEARPAGISVIAVYPGGMKTELFDEKRPADYDQYMEPSEVAEKIVANIMAETPEENQVIKRPSQFNK